MVFGLKNYKKLKMKHWHLLLDIDYDNYNLKFEVNYDYGKLHYVLLIIRYLNIQKVLVKMEENQINVMLDYQIFFKLQ